MQVPLSPEKKTSVIHELIQLTREMYVYPEKGEQIADSLQDKLDNGDYESFTDPNILSDRLTADLRRLSEDKHWSISYKENPAADIIDPEKETDGNLQREWIERAKRKNFGFNRVVHLDGNIGYIDLREFFPSEFAGETATAAMQFVSNCDALIFDVRKNHGGYPSMVQMIISYLIEPEPSHINSFYYRPTDRIQQFWTFPYVPGKRLPDVPVYVLTSSATGSGAEEFVYDLKNMDRATLIGETTVGAAHPVTMEVIQEKFYVRLPYGRPINPITNKNWEGVGVSPHISVPQEKALETAHLLAVEKLLERHGDNSVKYMLEWSMDLIRIQYSPFTPTIESLKRFAGHYGVRSFKVYDGALVYNHDDYDYSFPLAPIDETHFHLDGDIKFNFRADHKGDIFSVEITYRDNRAAVISEKD